MSDNGKKRSTMRFPIGTEVICMDQNNLRLEPRRGVIVGHDTVPPPRAKRSGPCYVIKFPGSKGCWEHRQEDEVNATPEAQATLDTVVLDLKGDD